MDIDKNLNISLLLEVYEGLLTDKQREFLGDYANNNMSLSEIGEVYGITRQAAYDLVSRTTKALENYENKLNLLKKFNTVKNEINAIIESDISQTEIKSRLNKILEIL